MTWLHLLIDGIFLGAVVVCFVLLSAQISERCDRRRARYYAAQERDEPRADALVACVYCGRETVTINGRYSVICECRSEAGT